MGPAPGRATSAIDIPAQRLHRSLEILAGVACRRRRLCELVSLARRARTELAERGVHRAVYSRSEIAHTRSTSRSCGVMPVTFDGGMALDQAAAMAMSRALALMRAVVSSSTPLGGTVMPAHTGSLAWHMLQRLVTISSTCVNVAAAAPAASARLRGGSVVAGPSVDSHTMVSPHTPANPHVHHGLG